MDRGERGGDGRSDREDLGERERARPLEARAERLAADVLHREREDAGLPVLVDLVVADDVAMLDAAQRACLGDDLLEERGPDTRREEQLQGDDADLDAAVLLGGEVDRREPALAQLRDEPERPDAAANLDAVARHWRRTYAIRLRS